MTADSQASSGLSNSFTDLMTSLAIIFILLLCASLNNAHQESERTRNSIIVEVQNALKDFTSGGIEVKSDPRDALSLLVLVPEDLLAFGFDKADVSPGGETFLRSFVPKLSRIICSPRFASEINSVVVEGHTDSSGTAEHNWDLSQKRSMAVVRTSLSVLATEGTKEEKLAFLNLLSAAGRGSADLVTGSTGQEDAPSSRRVVFKIRVRSLEQKQLIEALGPQGA
jgi:outer membrane protein OmpA-like peptidoglycan-associated protein